MEGKTDEEGYTESLTINSNQPVVSTSGGPEDVSGFMTVTINNEEWFENEWIECLDKSQSGSSVWCESQIMRIEQNEENNIYRIKIHYKGWDSKWDEWIDVNYNSNDTNKELQEPRIAKLYTNLEKPTKWGIRESNDIKLNTIGTNCDVLDDTSTWREGSVIEYNNKHNYVRINYSTYNNTIQHYLWLKYDSYRIATKGKWTNLTNTSKIGKDKANVLVSDPTKPNKKLVERRLAKEKKEEKVLKSASWKLCLFTLVCIILIIVFAVQENLVGVVICIICLMVGCCCFEIKYGDGED